MVLFLFLLPLYRQSGFQPHPQRRPFSRHICCLGRWEPQSREAFRWKSSLQSLPSLNTMSDCTWFFLDALASLDFKLSLTVSHFLQLAHLRVFQSYCVRNGLVQQFLKKNTNTRVNFNISGIRETRKT